MDAFLADGSIGALDDAALVGARALQARLYREIGVAAVAAALGLTDDNVAVPSAAPVAVEPATSQAA